MKFIFFLSFLFTGVCVNAQNETDTLPVIRLKGNLNCLYKNKFSAEKRKKNYPFNIADTVKIVSFRYHFNNYPIDSNTFITDSLIDIRTLNESEVDVMTDIIYNNFYKRKPNYLEVAGCFWPRHAILFIDDKGKLLESVLICFSCDRYRLSSKNIDFGDRCLQKMNKLKSFFKLKGIKFGLDKEHGLYPGETSDYLY